MLRADVPRDGRLVRAEYGPKVQGGAAREQHASQDRTERLCARDGAESRRDRLGGSVGLLGGETSLAERERGHVAGCIDLGAARNASVSVGGDEAARIVRQSADERAGHPRERDHAVRRDRPAPGGAEEAVPEVDRGSPCVKGDAALVQELRHRFRGGRTEQVERSCLRRHERDVGRGESARAELDRGHDRELIGREGPCLQ
jgi:hypothetical protein